MATWKKLLVSGSDISQLNNDSAYLVSGDSNIQLSGSFSGSFEGDGSALTGLVTNLDISGSTGNTSVDLLTQDFSISSGNSISTEATDQTITVAVTDGGIGTTQLADGNVTNIKLQNDSIQIGTTDIELGATGSTVADLTLTGVVASGSFSGSFEGDASGLTGTGGSILSGDAADNQVAVFNSSNTIDGYANFTFNDGNNTLTVDGTGSFTSDLTVGGNLIVTGDTINANVTNLDIEDRFILLNSGSNTIGDSGIVFGGSNGTAQQGAAVIWDASYNSNDGRLAIVNDIASNATGDQTPNYHVAGVYEGTEANAATAQADHVGNIRVESGDIFIYV